MPRISKIKFENASPEVLRAAADHIAEGYRITNEKLTLFHNLAAFNAIEENSYTLDRELQRLIGKRAADFFEYAVSLENDCLVCSTYFSKLLKDNGIDFETFSFTEQENVLIEYGRALAHDAKNISDELFDRLKTLFSEEEIVVITAMGCMMIANNYFNDALQIEPAL